MGLGGVMSSCRVWSVGWGALTFACVLFLTWLMVYRLGFVQAGGSL